MLNITTSLYKLTFTPATQAALENASEAAAAAKAKAEAESIIQRARNWKLFQLDVNYRWSDIVFDERYAHARLEDAKNAYGVEGQDVRAGDRAPDAPGLVCLRPAGAVGDNLPKRLFDIYSPAKHTVLLFGVAHVDDKQKVALEVVESLPASLFQKAVVLPADIEDVSVSITTDYFLRDDQGHAYKNFGVAEGKFVVVVVRPDGVVGAVALSATGVNDYVAAVFNL